VEDYLAGRPPATDFYTGHPTRLEDFRTKLDEVNRRFGREQRRAAAAALRPTSAGAADRLRRFVEEGGAVVTTGQQAGLFTGPLYTVHKILTAIRLAERLEDALGALVLPVFWIASEDHDFGEAAETFVVDAHGDLTRLAVSRSDPRPLPMSETRLESDISNVLDELCNLLARAGDNAQHITDYLGGYREGSTISEAFGQAIEEMFAGFDLLVVDAADPALKAASAGVLTEAVARSDAHEAALASRTRMLGEAGYGGQVVLVPGAANVFFHGSHARERLERVGGGWRAPANRQRFADGEVVAAIREEPGRFSPNVLLRPVVESAVFPTLAYVGGPAEVAYFAQAAPLFDAYGIRPPIAFPRFSATLVPAGVDAARPSLPVSDDELRLPEHEVWSLVARRTLPPQVVRGLEDLRRSLVQGFGPLMEAAEAIDPNLRPALGARRDRAMLEIAEAERKVLAHHKKRSPAMLSALRLVRNHLAPHGGPQERTLNVLPFLAREPGLLHRLAGEVQVGLDAS
jgi:bacillithiol synthase